MEIQVDCVDNLNQPNIYEILHPLVFVPTWKIEMDLRVQLNINLGSIPTLYVELCRRRLRSLR